jgi:hypothetical protein
MKDNDSQYLTVNGRRYYYDADFDVYRRVPSENAEPCPNLVLITFLVLLAAVLYVALR